MVEWGEFLAGADEADLQAVDLAVVVASRGDWVRRAVGDHRPGVILQIGADARQVQLDVDTNLGQVRVGANT